MNDLNGLQNGPRHPALLALSPKLATRLGACLLAVVLTGCASGPKPAPVMAPAPAQPTLTELMQDAQNAVQAGAKERSRQVLRDAAKAYPTSKEPWGKLASDYFEALDYGNAILAAQEVTQRDPQDGTAHSILAVSGLRVSSAALATLRAQQAGMPSDTRTEAQNLTRMLRETLGEQVLVPRADAAPAVTPPARRNARPAARVSAPATAGAPAAQGAAAAPNAAAAPGRSNAANANPGTPASAVNTARPAAAGAPTAPAAPAVAKPAAPAAPVAPKAAPAPAAKPAANPFDILR